jgi:hypothetical protein
VLDPAIRQLGGRILSLKRKLNKYNLSIPYLAEDFFEKLTNDFSELNNEINEYTKLNEIMYGTPLGSDYFKSKHLGKKDYDIKSNAQHIQSLKTLYEKFTAPNSTEPNSTEFKFCQLTPTNFQKIKNGDFSYVTQELESLLLLSQKDATYFKFFANKMMKIIQSIPFNHADLPALNVEESAKLMTAINSCLITIDTHCSAYNCFCEECTSKETKKTLTP